MQKIYMSDLYGQYLTIKEEIDTAIQDVIKSSQFIKSGKVLVFEKELSDYLNTNIISCGNGTDALQIALMAHGLKPGDEVITTPFTFIATVEVLALLGLKPVFVDSSFETFNIDENKIEESVSLKTKALLPVHLFGQCACLESINAIAKKHGLAVIEDACQSLGTDYIFNDGSRKKAGTIGIIGCNSFFPSKNLGAFGDGGAIYCSDDELASDIRSIANHGQSKKYYYDRIGVNSRLDSIQAAILEVKLKYIDKHIKARQKAAAYYDFKLKDIEQIQIPKRVGYSTHTFHQYTIKTLQRDGLKDYLQKQGIPSMIYYPKPLHLHKAYQYLGYKIGDFPVAEKLSETVLSLPMHTELTEEQLDYITNKIISYFRN